MTATSFQLLAVSALVGEVEQLTASGDLSEAVEQRLRWLIGQTLSAFKLPSRDERAPAKFPALSPHELI